MKRIIALLFFALVFSGTKAQLELSPNAEVSLYTCGMGDDLYALFGHTAIRIKDESQSLDRVYNYGTFSFGQGFYTKFTMGQLNYKLSAYGFQGFLSEYEYYQRSIKKQVLNLDQVQKEKLYNLLEVNALPQNAYYLYDFFYDNCSTRPRDIIEKVTGKINYPDLDGESPKSFRQLIDEYLAYSPWADFGIDIGLGSVCDTPTTTRGYMFLPEYLFQAYEGAEVNGKPLVKKSEVVFTPEKQRSSALNWNDPIVVFWVFCALVALFTIAEWRSGKRYILFDRFFFSLIGLVGWLVAFLWFVTDHQATKANWNILWAIPLNFPIALFVFKRELRRFDKYYQWLILIGSSTLVICWAIIPQQMHIAILPLLLAIIIRVSHSLIRIKR